MPLNRGHEYCEQLGPRARGLALADYLSRRYPHTLDGEWRRRIDAGLVLLDGARAGAHELLRTGQVLTWRRPAWDEPSVPDDPGLVILHEDVDLVAADKPAGLPTLPGAGFLEQTLLARVRRRYPEASPVHRLGRWTSGIVLFARTRAAAAALATQLREGEVKKRYRALAVGAPARAAFTIGVPIGPVPHARLGTVHAATSGGRQAKTHVEVLERRDGAFLADVRIETGRPHQIRIHLAAAGHPLVGDPLYAAGGLPIPGSTAVPGDPGYHLHAAEVVFSHPGNGRTVTVLSTPPAILDARR